MFGFRERFRGSIFTETDLKLAPTSLCNSCTCVGQSFGMYMDSYTLHSGCEFDCFSTFCLSIFSPPTNIHPSLLYHKSFLHFMSFIISTFHIVYRFLILHHISFLDFISYIVSSNNNWEEKENQKRLPEAESVIVVEDSDRRDTGFQDLYISVEL